jgi:hypothetical protein
LPVVSSHWGRWQSKQQWRWPTLPLPLPVAFLLQTLSPSRSQHQVCPCAARTACTDRGSATSLLAGFSCGRVRSVCWRDSTLNRPRGGAGSTSGRGVGDEGWRCDLLLAARGHGGTRRAERVRERAVVVSSSTVLPGREEKDPGWFSPSATDLFPERKAKDPGWFQVKELKERSSSLLQCTLRPSTVG